MSNELIARWFRAFFVALGVFILFSLYLYIRREIYNLGIANKALGSTAAVIAGGALLIGPISRKFPQLGSLLAYRRPFGVTAFFTGLAHATVSLFFIPERFNIQFFLREWPATLAGLIAIGLWIYLASISRNVSIERLGGSTWTARQQRGGHIAYLAVFFHLISLKWAGWIEWFSGKTQKTPSLANPEFPPASLFVFIIMAAIIGYRVYFVIKHHVRSDR